MNCSTAGLPVHHQLPELLKLTSIELVVSSSHLILCHPLLLLPPIPPSIRVFSSESSLCMRWPKYWSFSFSISPSNEHLGLISFRWTGWIALQSKGLSRVFSNTAVPKHQFFGACLSSQSNSHIYTGPLENAVLGCNFKNGRMVSVCFQGKPFNITIIQVYALTSNTEKAEVEWFYEDLQDLLELTPKKDVFFIIGDWKVKVGGQGIPRVTGKFGLEYRMKQGKG